MEHHATPGAHRAPRLARIEHRAWRASSATPDRQRRVTATVTLTVTMRTHLLTTV